jgi:thiol-disulfide isomerase/thioredoxin
LAGGGKAQSASKDNIHYLTDTNTNFDGLISQFKGKVIYIDMWATWCSPCRHELQSKKDIKGFEAFALKNNIVVLYICCDKNGDKWKQFVTANKLAGYHTLINNSINEDFHTTFSMVQNRRGKLKRSFYLPRHLIIDKKGMVVDSIADRQGSAAVYAQLNKMLNKTSVQLTK